MKQQITLNHATFIATVFSITTWQRQFLATSIATFLLAVASNISIPTYPVPFSLQSLAVLLIGANLGRKLGVLAILQYLFVGALGLPVFANGGFGIAGLIAPSAGYLYGFIVSAYIAGLAAEKGYDRHFFTGVMMFAIAHQVIFVFGVAYLASYLHVSLVEAIKIGYLPFVGFDLLKFVAAALMMYAVWRVKSKKS
ncbi:biotin transporter BioY [Orbaceae bacterium ac157xtp]